MEKERVSLGIKQLSSDPLKSDKIVNKIVTGIITEIEKDKIIVKFEGEKMGFTRDLT